MRSALLAVLLLAATGCDSREPAAPEPPPAVAPAPAPTGGGSICEANWKVMNEYAEASGTPFTPRDVFLAGCRELPEPLQRCANIDYQMQNMARCGEELAKDKALEAKFREIMKKR